MPRSFQNRQHTRGAWTSYAKTSNDRLPNSIVGEQKFEDVDDAMLFVVFRHQ